MSTFPLSTTRSPILLACVALTTTIACRPSDVLRVPPPTTTLSNAALQNQSGAELVFNGAKASVFYGLEGSSQLIQWSELLTDDYTFSNFESSYGANIDARSTTDAGGFSENGNYALQQLLTARFSLALAARDLAQFEPASGQSKVGEAYALMGYTELFLAEDYCAGIPLNSVPAVGGVVYGTALTTDSLLGVAETDFDTAAAHAAGDTAVIALASVGLGRARLDRGDYTGAVNAVANVPTAFVYNTQLEPNYSSGTTYQVNLYAGQFSENYGCGVINVADHEGQNGLNFLSAHDPRLALDSSMQTCDGEYLGTIPGTWYYPVKFGDPPTGLVPISTGIEARLMEAEGALQTSRANAVAMLNALRTNGSFTVQTVGMQVDTVYQAGTGGVDGLAPLSVPATDSAATDLVFRERAFWLFGTGIRQGDLRRLIRQYHRVQTEVFPTGVYPNGENPNLNSPLPNYGTDVAFTLPTGQNAAPTTNPNYKGCTTPTSQA